MPTENRAGAKNLYLAQSTARQGIDGEWNCESHTSLLYALGRKRAGRRPACESRRAGLTGPARSESSSRCALPQCGNPRALRARP